MDQINAIRQTETSPDSIQARIQRMVALDPRGLTAGAYGDEGEILMQIENRVANALDAVAAEEHRKVLLEPVERLHPSLTGTLLDMAREIIAAWMPIRWQAHQREIDATLMAVMGVFRAKRLSPEWALDEKGVLVLELEKRILKAVHARSTFCVARGDSEWQILLEADLLVVLGPFLREE